MSDCPRRKLGKFWTADSAKFPLTQQAEPSVLLAQPLVQASTKELVYPVRKYLLRNWGTIPPHNYVRWDTASKDQGWAIEDAGVINDVVVYEKVNGMLPEIGITPTNSAAVHKHKQIKYLQKMLILRNTWRGKAP